MVGCNQANSRHRGRGCGRGSISSGRGRGPEAAEHGDHGLTDPTGVPNEGLENVHIGRGRGDEATNHGLTNATRFHGEGSENVRVGAGTSRGRGSHGGHGDEATGHRLPILGEGLENLGIGLSRGRASSSISGNGDGAVEYHRPRTSHDICMAIRIRRGRGRGISISGRRGNEAAADTFDDNVVFNGEGLENLHIDDDGERELSECPEGSNTQGSVHTGHINRMLLFLDPSGQQFENHGAVGRKIVANLRNMFGGGWPTWRSVPAVARERLWDHFRYEWDSEIEELVRGLWEVHNANRYSGMLRNVREEAFDRAEEDGIDVGDDLSLLIPYCPPWIRQEYWLLLVRHWNSEKWKKVSRVNKANKANSRGGFHTNGSATFLTTRRRLEKKKGGCLPMLEFFTYAHTKAGTKPREVLEDGPESGMTTQPEFVDDRSRIQVETYTRRIIEKHGDNLEDHLEFDEELWNECAGGRKRGRLYRGSNSKDPVYVLTGAPSSSSTHQRRDPEEVKKLLETVEELQAREEERNESERADREEREGLHQTVEDMKKKVAELLKYLPQPPPNP